jgi:hypothetical protein
VIGRRRRERERARRLADPDTVSIDIEPTLEQLESTVQLYDKVRARYLRVLAHGGR